MAVPTRSQPNLNWMRKKQEYNESKGPQKPIFVPPKFPGTTNKEQNNT